MLASFLIVSAAFLLRISLAREHRIELQTGLGVFAVRVFRSLCVTPYYPKGGRYGSTPQNEARVAD